MSPKEVIRRLSLGQGSEYCEALFVHGQNPEAATDVLKDLAQWGFATLTDYLMWACRGALRLGLLPHANVGIVEIEKLRKLSAVNASMGLMLEASVDLPVHRKSPSKAPMERIRFIEAAGKLRIPFTTGLLVGIGESSEDRVDGLRAIADLAETYQHIQEVIIQPVVPSSRYPVAPPTRADLIEAVTQARKILPEEVAIQIPPNLISSTLLIELLANGATDLGGISPWTSDDVNPVSPWPALADLSRILMDHHVELQARLPLYPRFLSSRWCSDDVWAVVELYAKGVYS